MPNREVLLDVALAGPLWGSVASAGLLLLGAGLSAAGLGDVTIDSPALADSFLAGAVGQLTMGDALAQPEVRPQPRAGNCVCEDDPCCSACSRCC